MRCSKILHSKHSADSQQHDTSLHDHDGKSVPSFNLTA
jgi:hypothetical protein